MANQTARYGLPFDPWESQGAIVKGAVKEVIEASKKYLDKSLKSISVLDVGSGHGEYSMEMAKFFDKVTGVEPFKDAYKVAIKIAKGKNLKFFNSKIEDFKTKSKFDLVTHFTVFEHMSTPYEGFDRIFSLLNKNGIIYLTAQINIGFLSNTMVCHFYRGCLYLWQINI